MDRTAGSGCIVGAVMAGDMTMTIDDGAGRLGSFKQWQDARLTPEVVAKLINVFLSNLFNMEVSKYTQRLGRYEWELTLLPTLQHGEKTKIGSIVLSEMISNDPDTAREVIGVRYGCFIRDIPPVQILSEDGTRSPPDRGEAFPQLLMDICVQGKMYVDNHFNFGATVSKKTPWDAEPHHRKRRVLRLWHPLGSNMMRGAVADQVWGTNDGLGTKRVSPEADRDKRARQVTRMIHEMRQEHGEDIVPFKHLNQKRKKKK